MTYCHPNPASRARIPQQRVPQACPQKPVRLTSQDTEDSLSITPLHSSEGTSGGSNLKTTQGASVARGKGEGGRPPPLKVQNIEACTTSRGASVVQYQESPHGSLKKRGTKKLEYRGKCVRLLISASPSLEGVSEEFVFSALAVLFPPRRALVTAPCGELTRGNNNSNRCFFSVRDGFGNGTQKSTPHCSTPKLVRHDTSIKRGVHRSQEAENPITRTAHTQHARRKTKSRVTRKTTAGRH